MSKQRFMLSLLLVLALLVPGVILGPASRTASYSTARTAGRFNSFHRKHRPIARRRPLPRSGAHRPAWAPPG